MVWKVARRGIIGSAMRHDPRVAEEFLRGVIFADPRRQPDYHLYRLNALYTPILLSGLPMLLAGAVVGYLGLDGSWWMLTIIPVLGFTLLACWRGVMHWLANGRAERLPAGLMRSSWTSVLVAMLVATSMVTMVIAV